MYGNMTVNENLKSNQAGEIIKDDLCNFALYASGDIYTKAVFLYYLTRPHRASQSSKKKKVLSMPSVKGVFNLSFAFKLDKECRFKITEIV